MTTTVSDPTSRGNGQATSNAPPAKPRRVPTRSSALNAARQAALLDFVRLRDGEVTLDRMAFAQLAEDGWARAEVLRTLDVLVEDGQLTIEPDGHGSLVVALVPADHGCAR